MSHPATPDPAEGTVTIRPATPADAKHMARLVDMAGEGLASYFWRQIAEPGEDAWAVGERRAAGDAGAFSWRNATIADVGGEVAGMLVTYPIGSAPEPLDELPPLIRPLQELENRALATFYVNVLAIHERFRRRGIGRRLLERAAEQAEGRDMSLIVASGNNRAIGLYEAFGFRERGRKPVIEDGGWSCESPEWVLFVRPGTATG